jgi:hypothetical protein
MRDVAEALAPSDRFWDKPRRRSRLRAIVTAIVRLVHI